jgi:hypothetical protein
MDLGEILDNVFRIYRARFPLLAGLAVLVSLPSLLLQYLTGAFSQMGFIVDSFGRLAQGATTVTPPPQTEFSNGTLIAFGVGYLIVIVLLPFSTATVLHASLSIALGEPTGFLLALRGVLDRYWTIWGYLLAFGLFAFATLVFCITIPLLVWVAVPWWGVGLPALLVERVGPFRSLSRGFDLVRGHWWRSAGILLLLILLSWLLSYPILILFGGLGVLAALVPFLPAVVKGGLVYAATVVSSALLVPIFELGRTVLYLDLRVRNEAYDLQRLAQQAVAGG